MKRHPESDRFAIGEAIAAQPEQPAEIISVKPKEKTILPAPAKRSPRQAAPSPTPEKPVPIRPGVRAPNTAYPREGNIYVKCPKALCRALDAAVLAEKIKRDPVPMDKGIAIEEAVRMWLRSKGYPTE